MTDNEYKVHRLNQQNEEEDFRTLLIDEGVGIAVTQENSGTVRMYWIMKWKEWLDFWDVETYTADEAEAEQIFFDAIAK